MSTTAAPGSQSALTSRELLDTLVSFDTTSRLSNLALIDFVADYLNQHGVHVDVLPSEDGVKANLYATIGPDQPGGIILSGHTDVVPVDGQDWSTDPFTLHSQDGLLYGRGTSDMKGFVACCLAAVPRFAAAGLKRPIHLAFSYDEEVGCVGVRPMIDHIVANRPRPDLCIVGEPSNMRVINAHKGIRSMVTSIRGREGHSSAPDQGANAIAAAAKLIVFLETLNAEMMERGDPSGRFTPPRTTISVGVIRGGSAYNIIARDCVFDWEYRSLPDTDQAEVLDRLTRYAEEEVLPKLRETAPEASIQTEIIGDAPALGAVDGSPAESLTLFLAERNTVEAVAYGTEAGLFQRADIPTVICGPGDIAQAHRPNEFISEAQLAACDAFMARLNEKCRD